MKTKQKNDKHNKQIELCVFYILTGLSTCKQESLLIKSFRKTFQGQISRENVSAMPDFFGYFVGERFP